VNSSHLRKGKKKKRNERKGVDVAPLTEQVLQQGEEAYREGNENENCRKN